MPGVQGVLSWEMRDAGGSVTHAGETHNLLLDQGRSAYAGSMRLGGADAASGQPTHIHLGTGTSLPSVSDTALTTFITSMSSSATGLGNNNGSVEGNYTARLTFLFSTTQMTGLITEALLASNSGGGASVWTAWARATLSANHVSGTTMLFTWRVSTLA